MKGYYCIYDSSLDRWWSNSETWIDHRFKLSHNIETDYELEIISTNNIYPTGVQFDLKPKNTDIITFCETEPNVRFDEIMKFTDMRDTETYIYNRDWYLEPESFLSIRKIYK